MRKEEIITHWTGLEEGQKIKMRAIPYRHEGSTFDCDGIRITGKPEFIDSVLSRLKDLLEKENSMTRLQLNYQQAQDKNTKEMLNSYCCYIQVHKRGRQAQMVNAFCDARLIMR